MVKPPTPGRQVDQYSHPACLNSVKSAQEFPSLLPITSTISSHFASCPQTLFIIAFKSQRNIPKITRQIRRLPGVEAPVPRENIGGGEGVDSTTKNLRLTPLKHHPVSTSSGLIHHATVDTSDFVRMTSKVLVKLPTVPFTQGKKPTTELVTLPTRSEGAPAQIRSQQGISDRAAQLEQNMKFLQEQHQATLIALHQEVEILRQRNRDLQFQLVFTKGTACVSSSPSSPEDNSNGFVKSKGSPVSVNVTPLQIELLERDLEELRVSFNESKKQNQQLQDVIEEQKIKLEKSEKRKDQNEVSDVGIQVGETQGVQADLAVRLEDAEALVKRLRRENADQQREIATIKSASAKNGNRSGHGRGRGNENGHHSRGASGDPGQSNRHPYKFPPLEGESYWRNAPRGRGSYDHHSAHYQRRNRLEDDANNGDMSCIVLPELRIGSMKNDAQCYPPMYRSQRGYHNGGNYYRDSGNRKFRGQGRQRRDQESRDHRGDYKDRNQKGQQHQGEYNEAPHTSKKN